MAEALTIAMILEARDRAGETIDRIKEKIDSLAASAEETSAKVSEASDKMDASLNETAASADREGIAMDRTAADANVMSDSADESSSKMGLLSKAGMGAAAAVVGIGILAVKSAMDFQNATASLANHAGITTAAAQKIGEAFLSTAGHSRYSAQQIMEAYAPVSGEFTNLYGHALNAGQSLTVMKAAMDLAEASGEGLTSTTKVLADTMLPFHISVQKSAAAANVLWNTSRLLGIPLTTLGQQFDRLRPLVAGSGMSVSTLSGLMVELSHSLGSGRMASREAGRAIQSLIDPSSSANKALDAMGVSLFNAKGKFIGMPSAISKLKTGLAGLPGSAGAVAAEQQVMAITSQLVTDHLQPQTAAMKKSEAALTAQKNALNLTATAFTKSSAMQAIFGRNANAMLAVIAGGSSTLNHYVGMVSKSGEVQSAAARNAKTLSLQIEQAKVTVEDLVTKLGMALIPVLMHVASDLSMVVGWFEKHTIVAKVLAAIIGGVLAVAIAVWIANMVTAGIQATLTFAKMILGAVTASAATVASAAASAAAWVAANAVMIAGMALVAAVVVGAALLIIKYHKQIEAAAIAVWHAIEDAARAAWHEIATIVETTVSFIKSHWQLILAILLGPIAVAVLEIKDHFAQIEDFAHTAISDVESVFDELPGKVLSIVDDIVSFFVALPGRIISALGNIGSQIGHVFSSAVSHIPVVGGILSKLAAGGIVTSPTLALVGEAGPEVVVPLSAIGGVGVVGKGGVSPLPVHAPLSAAGGIGGGSSANMTVNLYVQGALYGDMNTALNDLGRYLATVLVPGAGVRLSRTA